MNSEKTDKIIPTEELDNVLPKYEHIKLSGKNLAQQYVSAFNTGMNIYQCINYLQGNIEWLVNATNNVVKTWNDSVNETLSESIEITEKTTTKKFNEEWENKQPELTNQVNTLTTKQFNVEKTTFNDKLNTLNDRMDTFTKLSEGSTTGDAELHDIRVGANGITYNMAGNAVRGQYKDLYDEIAKVEEINNSYVFNNGKYTIDNMFINSSGLNENSNYNCTPFIDCTNILKLIINGTSLQTSGFNYAFYTDNSYDTLIYGKLIKEQTTIIEVPNNAKYLVLCKHKNDNFNAKTIPYINKELNKFKILNITQDTNIDTNNLILEDNYIKRSLPLEYDYDNYMWLKTDENINGVKISSKLITNEITRLSLKMYNNKIFTINIQNTSSGLSLLCYDENVNKLPGIKYFYGPSNVSEYELTLIQCGQTIFSYVNGDVFGYINNPNFTKIKQVGYAFKKNHENSYYKLNYTTYKKKSFCHLSLDDQFLCLKDITLNDYSSVFKSPYFKPLKELHDKYGCVFTLMLFKTDSITNPTWDISQTTTKYKDEFIKNSHWLKFGFHGVDFTTHPSDENDDVLLNYIKDVYNDIVSFSGECCIDTVPRLSFFSAKKEQVIKMKNNNLITGLLTADDKRTSNVGLGTNELWIMNNYDTYTDFKNNICYFRSEQRIDDSDMATRDDVISALNEKYDDKNNSDIFIIFGHKITTNEMQERFKLVCEWIKEKNLKYDYSMNNINY